MPQSGIHSSSHSREFRLVLLCCRPKLLQADRSRVQSLLAGMDVAAFLDLAIVRHRVGPLVHALLSSLPPGALPTGLLPSLAACARANAVKVLQAQRAHVLLSRWFAEAGLDWLPFKGITVALKYYADPSVRHVNDMDVWVPPSLLPQARDLLLGHGYQQLDGSLHGDLAARGPRHAAYLASYYHEEQLYSPELGHLELHWRLADNPFQFRLAPETLRKRAVPLRLGPAELQVMNDVDLLLYLCDHGARHGWARLKWLVDLPRVLDSRVWDWDDLFARARAARCHHSLLLGLALSAQHLGWRAPPEVQRLLDRSRTLPLAMWLVGRFWRAPAGDETLRFHQIAALVFRELGMSLLLTNSWRSVIHQINRYLLSPKDLQVLELPDRWFGAYYVLRPFLVLARRTRALVQRQTGPVL